MNRRVAKKVLNGSIFGERLLGYRTVTIERALKRVDRGHPLLPVSVDWENNKGSVHYKNLHFGFTFTRNQLLNDSTNNNPN